VFQVVGVIAAVWFLVQTWQLWLLVFTGLVLAAAMLPAARVAARYRIPRGVTVLSVYVLAAGVLVLMGRLLWPALTEQWLQFMEQLPRMLDNLKGWIGNVQGWFGQWGIPAFETSVSTPKPQDLQGVVGTVVANTFRVTAGAIGAVVGLLVVLIIAAYIVIDAEQVGANLATLLPPRERRIAAALVGPVMERIGGYVRGQIVVSLCVGAVLAIGLSTLGVKYALLIGALAAVLNVVPFVGSLVAAILGVVSALNESVGLAIGTTLLFWGVNLLEGKLLVPHLVGRATGLHPLAVMVVLLAGAKLAGLIGALVSVPLLAAVWEIVKTLNQGEVEADVSWRPAATSEPGGTDRSPAG
jgi:predicted PurR-regulated permease PerM